VHRLRLQQDLGIALAANREGSETPHVVVLLPSYNVSQSLLDHYGSRLAQLEHRYLLAMFMMTRIPGVEIVFVTCKAPAPAVLDHYFSLVPEPMRDDVRRRFRLVEVPDDRAAPIADKLLRRPDLLDEIREHIAGRPAFIEPWNVATEELAVAHALDIPINGTTPELRPVAFKSAGRRLFRDAGVPVAHGVEDVRTVDDVARAIGAIRAERPNAAGVVVKLDDSGAGDGNVVVRFADDVDAVLRSLPEWYVEDLRGGGCVEELVTGDVFTSPSVQLELDPYGGVAVLATHEQLLGGDNGQVFLGCAFPADAAYARQLADYGMAIGIALAQHGAVGRVAVDFAAALDSASGTWTLAALEMNLRKGGTTHPYSALRHLVPGRYDAAAGAWRARSGGVRCYQCSDNLLDPAWLQLSEADAIDAIRDAGLSFDYGSGVGVVPHMLAGLAVDGRIGATAIAETSDEAGRMIEGVREALTRAASAAAAAAAAPGGRS
jgi:hypothetical protein